LPAAALGLIDELAHTNVPGSRNEKRWQDIEELLDAGHQRHLDGQHPAPRIVERCRHAITGVTQRETVPDAFVRAADQIELVDMSPEALRRRMAHGNVYAPNASTPRSRTTSGPATSARCASSRCCGWPTGRRHACSSTSPITAWPDAGKRASA
jgi:hypothetical protein